MYSKGSLRAKFCLAATTTGLFAGAGLAPASASETHVLKHGETVEYLARHFHVPVKDILAANHLGAQDVLRDGRRLNIPDAPRPVIVPHTMRKSGQILGNRISVRIGPASTQHRLRLCDNAAAVVVTARRGDWLQVTLEDGRSGWVRTDFVTFSGTRPPATLARREERSSGSVASTPVKHARARIVGHAQRDVQGTHSRAHARAIALAEAHRLQHDENVAHARKLRHLKELAAASAHHGPRSQAAARHHHDNEARANADRRHEAAVARARHLHDNEARANVARHHAAALARTHHHTNEARANAARHHEAAVAREHRHHNEMLANYLHRLQAKAARSNHHSAAVISRHEMSSRYTHRIRPEAESPSASNDVVRSAFAYRGTPYRWGESRPGGFDCSGFTKYIYARKGVSLPRTAAEQFHAGHAVAHKGMKPGDLVFFHTTRSGISHVGMYVGSGKFVHSSSAKSGGVRVDSLESGYYNHAFRGARRVRKAPTEASGE